MNDGGTLYCKLFVDTDASWADLIRLIARITSGVIDRYTVTTPWSDIDVIKNCDFDERRRHEVPDGFLYSRYYLDIDPVGDVDRSEYVRDISRLLEGLWGAGLDAVAACDFEEELPRCGGYNPERRGA